MDKTMNRFLAILAALTCAASAQTYRTVTADTNNVIRTNFSLVRSQVSDLSGASFAISNVTGLQTSLDAKIATNGSASGLTNFPALVLTTNSSATLFPTALLRTNGDGSALTNLPNANLGSATGVLPISNGGTGATNVNNALANLGLGTSATNNTDAFQPANTNLTALAGGDGSMLTNVTVTDASSLTNFPAELLRTNGNAIALTNFPFELLRTNGDGSGLSNVAVDLTTVLPAYSNNAGKVLAVAVGATNVEWTAISNTVTDASLLTNFPAIILQTNSSDVSFPAFLLRTNGSANALTNFPSVVLTTNSAESFFPIELLRTNGNAAALTNFPTLNQNTTGTASNVTGIVALTNGGTGANTASNARVNLLPSYTGNASRVLALNTNGTDVVWAVDGGGGAIDLSTTNVTGTLPLARGGLGATTTSNALENLGVFELSGVRIILGWSQSRNFSTSLIHIGKNSTNNSPNTVVIGHTTSVGTSSTGATVVGDSAKVGGSAGAATALGSSATANSVNAIQLGAGTNATTNSIQFRSAGVVTEQKWGYLASVSAQGAYAMTNTAGISGSKTFVAYDGTNYSTNTVTISNGIITGWTP